MNTKLYVAMVGLPAHGKSTVAKRIRDDLNGMGMRVAIFNNGELRRLLAGPDSTRPEFYKVENEEGREIRDSIALQNMALARKWLHDGGDIAILDATNASQRRRRFIEDNLTDHPVLFIECLNEDTVLQQNCIFNKTKLPEYKDYTTEEALESFRARIAYYESIYSHVGTERYWIQMDSMANRILAESPLDGCPFYPAIRELLVSTWVRDLYLVRHGQTEFNREGRIGGDPFLSAKGRGQAERLGRTMEDVRLDYIFTSTRQRSHETASYVIKTHPNAKVRALSEFDELSAGICENLRYEDIRRDMPEVTKGRNKDKFNFCYPKGESYAMLMHRVLRGLRRALFISGGAPTLIVGHQAINRIVLALFLHQRTEDIPYMFVPQDHYYHIENMPRRRLVERVLYKP